MPTIPAFARTALRDTGDTLHYVKSATVHNISTPERSNALDIVRWVYAVAGIAGDSPRFAYYVSRWLVPEKIARAKQQGTFTATVRHCPPIDPDWLRFVPAALEAYAEFTAPRERTNPSTRTPANTSRKSNSA